MFLICSNIETTPQISAVLILHIACTLVHGITVGRMHGKALDIVGKLLCCARIGTDYVYGFHAITSFLGG